MKVMILRASSNRFEIIEDFDHSLENMQAIVGGWLEAMPITPVNEEGREITLWLNEEGKMINLPPNFAIMDSKRKVLDIVMGDVLITASDRTTGEVVSMTDEEVQYIQDQFNMNFGLITPVFVTKTLFV